MLAASELPQGAAAETVADALRRATAELAAAGCEDAALDAQLLLASVLGCPRAHLLAHPERALADRERGEFAALVRRRLRREPLAYILGRWEFYGLELSVDRRVLIPRPETELLVEWALRQVERRGLASPALADVGTGSGAIAIALAKSLPRARVQATDISEEALQVARANAQRHGVAERIAFYCGDLLEPVPGRVHIVLANLPYVRRDERPTLPPEVRDYEPWLALDGGEDGLCHLRRLFGQARAHLHPGGLLAAEIGAGQGPAALSLAREAFPEAKAALLQDYAGHDRVVVVEFPH